jgi:hypothetical protein
MPKAKNEKYDKEQDEIINKIITILELDDKNSTTLYELENNDEKIKQINDLVPDISKFFCTSKVLGIHDTKRVKRPYLSIIRQICKKKYTVVSTDTTIKVNDDKIRTKRYIFNLIS